MRVSPKEKIENLSPSPLNGGYSSDVYRVLAQFFNTKLQRYAQNPQATSLLKNLLKDISAKRRALRP
ncbi:hypothetical protein [Helicobacter labacensis]|uniref:hypothetical protein n=1 Tax=Helicobacter labacensis TaxID=2316079 RepID=UPI000EB52E7E|nr:hypothetical protein [Helicobacter labacensis]